ncbi:MAG: hypothetical protein M3Z10_14835 [Gemmatimonadota bacterium]|nr:hypothetical protein [Gemmatimonadota bacterium]
MRLEILTVAAALALAAPAGAQWATTCVRYTARIRTCSARYVAPPAPARRTLTTAPSASHGPVDVETLDEQETVLSIWRATGVAFESHGHRTLLEARVIATRGGIHLVVPAEMGLPGGIAFDLPRVAPMVYRGTDGAQRVVTFRVAGGRAELLVTGANGDGLVTWQFDEHEPPR